MTTPSSKRNWRYFRNLTLATLLVVVSAFYIIVPVFRANSAIHPTRFPVGNISPADVDWDFENVTLTTSDGVSLSGWYIPSQNGAAVIAVHAYNGNRTGVIYHASMLAKHGYGVLLFDLRAHGESGGETFAFGWDGDKDVLAAITYLQRRPDVDPDRIGALGLSIGAEIVLQTAAYTDQLQGVVAEGSGFRMLDEWRLAPEPPGWILTPGYWTFFSAGEILSGVPRALPLTELVPEITPTPLFLISAGADNPINQIYFEAAQAPKALWARPEDGHIDGLFTHPQEYEEKVVVFFDNALLKK